jgi:hypothetical protein
VAQEVLRFGFRGLWQAFAGVDSRVLVKIKGYPRIMLVPHWFANWLSLQELERALAAQQLDSQRQQKHLEGIAQTLNAMSEQLRVYVRYLVDDCCSLLTAHEPGSTKTRQASRLSSGCITWNASFTTRSRMPVVLQLLKA